MFNDIAKNRVDLGAERKPGKPRHVSESKVPELVRLCELLEDGKLMRSVGGGDFMEGPGIILLKKLFRSKTCLKLGGNSYEESVENAMFRSLNVIFLKI